MPALLPWGVKQFCDGNGNPLVGGWVAYCQPGTGGQIFRNVYGDEAETILLTNPVPLDASGRPYSGGSQQSIWGDGTYQEYVYDAQGVLQTSSIIDTQSGPANVVRQHQQLSSGLGFPLTQGGMGSTDDRGHGEIRFDTPFATVTSIVCTPFNAEYPTVISIRTLTETGFLVQTGPRTQFFWIAVGA